MYFIPPLFGEGYGLINNLLHGNHKAAIGSILFFNDLADNIWVIIGLLFGITIFKAIAMTITFAAGGVGGALPRALRPQGGWDAGLQRHGARDAGG